MAYDERSVGLDRDTERGEITHIGRDHGVIEDLLRGRSIEAIAAACLHKAGREEGRWLTQSDVAETGNVTPTTVRTHHATLEEQVV